MPTGGTFAGKRVLVTGGTRGAGRATTRAFLDAGARAVACYRDDAEAAAELVKEYGDAVRAVRADVTKQADVARLADECRDALGGLDVLVNNAGVDGAAAFAELSLPEWRRVVDVDVTAAYRVTRTLLPLLAPGGAVVTIGAASALRGRPGAAHHGAAKAAVIGLTASLAKELGPRGIRVNTVAPGLVDHPGGGPPPPVLAAVRSMTALGRLPEPRDVAAAVCFLAGDAARCVTGITLNVDGGM